MTMRKFLFLNATEGVSEEQNQTTDEITLAKATLAGISGVGLNLQNNTIVNLGTPVNATDAATKGYVDTTAYGLSPKTSVRALSATSIASLSGAPVTVDGISVSAGQRVFLPAQTDGRQNGPWVVQSGAWTRPVDFAVGSSASGAFFYVEQGTTYGNQQWGCTNTPGADVVGTDSLTFSQINGLGDIINGNGLAKNANTLSVVLATNSGLQFTGAALDHLLVSGGGLSKSASGLQLFINASPSTLVADTNGLRVTGVPGLFLINGVAVDANVTATNLNTLNDGATSFADALHNHNLVAGAQTLQATATNSSIAALNAGDPVAWSSTANTLLRGDAASDAASRIFGVAAAGIATNGTGTVLRQGVLAGVLSSATPGAPYWLASGGGLTASCPTVSGNRVIRIGFAKNATDLDIRIQDMGKRS